MRPHVQAAVTAVGVASRTHLLSLVLVTAALLRVNILSLVYLLLALVHEGVTSPWRNPGGSRLGLVTPALFLSVAFCLTQFIFQIVLVSHRPYGSLLGPTDSTTTRVLTLFGLCRLDSTTADIVLTTVPDIVVALVCTVLYIVRRVAGTRVKPNASWYGQLPLSNLSNNQGEDETTEDEYVEPDGRDDHAPLLPGREEQARYSAVTQKAHRIHFAAICVAAVAWSSSACLLALPYLWFCISTYLVWTFKGQYEFVVVRQWTPIMLYAAAHIFVGFLYQHGWFQDLVRPESGVAQLVGLYAVVGNSWTRDMPPYHITHLNLVPWQQIIQFLSVAILFLHMRSNFPGKLDQMDDSGLWASSTNQRRSSIVPNPSLWKVVSMKLMLRGNHVICFVVSMLWAMVWHSWLTFPLLLYGLSGWVLAVRITQKLVPYLALYTTVLTILSFVWDLDGVGFDHRQLPEVGLVHATPSLPVLGAKVLLLGVIGTCLHYSTEWRELWPSLNAMSRLSFIDPRASFSSDHEPEGPASDPLLFADGQTDHVHDEHSGQGEGSSGLGIRRRIRRLLQEVLQWLSMGAQYTYIVALVLLFFCALQQVNFFNAVYLIFFMVFIIYPSSAERYWYWLMLYCECVVVAVYVYKFEIFKELIDLKTAEVIGLVSQLPGSGPDWNLGWHLPILALLVIQWVVYKNVEVHGHRQAMARFRRMSMHVDGATIDEEITLEGLPLYIMLFGRVVMKNWMLVCLLLLMVNGLSGQVTLLKTGFLGLVYVFFLVNQTTDDSWAVTKGLWLAVPTYTGATLIAMYAYQFDYVSSSLQQFLTVEDLEDIGLVTAGENLREYLSGETLVLWATVIQLKFFSHMAATPETSLEVRLRRLGWDTLASTVEFGKRCCLVLSDKAALIMLFLAVISRIVALNVFNMALLMLVMALPGRRWLRGALMIWLQAATLVMTLVQTKWLQAHIKYSPEDMAWLGLGPDSRTVVQQYVLVIVLLALDRVAIKWARDPNTDYLNPHPSDEILFPLADEPNITAASLGAEHETNPAKRRDPARRTVQLAGGQRMEDDYIHISLANYFKYFCNNIVALCGLEACTLLTVAAACVCLNYHSLLYMAGAVAMMREKRATVARWWGVWVLFIAVLGILKYASLVYVPPSMREEVGRLLPWQDWEFNIKLWLFLPPDQARDQLNADFFLLLACMFQHRAFSAERKLRDRGDPIPRLFTPFNFFSKPWPVARVGELWFLKWFHWCTLVFAFFAGTVQTDIPSFGYIAFCFHFLRMGRGLLLNRRTRTIQWGYFLMFTYGVILLKLVWQLPTFLVKWDSMSKWLHTLRNIFALTEGLTFRATAENPKFTIAWSTDKGGILCDVILLCLIVTSKAVFEAELLEDVINYEKSDIRLTAKRATVLASNLSKSLRKELERQHAMEHQAEQRIQELTAKQQQQSTGIGQSRYLLFAGPTDFYQVVDDDTDGLETKNLDHLGDLGTVKMARRTQLRREYRNAYEQLQYWNWQRPKDRPAEAQKTSFMDVLTLIWAEMERWLWAVCDHLERNSRGYALLVGDVSFIARGTTPTTTAPDNGSMPPSSTHSPAASPPRLTRSQSPPSSLIDPEENGTEHHENAKIGEILSNSVISANMVKPDGKIRDRTPSPSPPRICSPVVIRLPEREKGKETEGEGTSPTHQSPRRSRLAHEEEEEGGLGRLDYPRHNTMVDLGSPPNSPMRTTQVPVWSMNYHPPTRTDSPVPLSQHSPRGFLPRLEGTSSRADSPITPITGVDHVRSEDNLVWEEQELWSDDTPQQHQSGAGTPPPGREFIPPTSMGHRALGMGRPYAAAQRMRKLSRIRTNELFARTNFSQSDMKALFSDHFVVVDAEGNLREMPDISMDASGMPRDFGGTAAGLVQRNREGLGSEILRSTLHYLLSHTAEVCYVGIVGAQLYHGNLLATVLPVSLFTWGLLLRPWPTKEFWGFATIYVEIVICAKYLFQLEMWGFNDPSTSTISRWVYMVGIQKNPEGSFVWSEAVDLLLLLLLLFHRYMSQRLATWDYKDHMPFPQPPGHSQDPSQIQSASVSSIVQEYGTRTATTATSDIDWASLRQAFTSPFATFKDFVSGTKQPGNLSPRDYFVQQLVFDFIAFLITACGWSYFSTDSGTIQQYITQSRIPLPFLLVLIGQFLLMLVDRAIYLRRAVAAKLCLQLTVCLGLNLYTFVMLPDLIRNTNSSSHRVTRVVGAWYAMKCMYMYYSALQLRHGYPRYLLSNFLTKKFGLFHNTLFRLYRGVPFMVELRSLMDWVFTNTTLTLFEWWKLDEIYSSLYLNKCRYADLEVEDRRLGEGKGILEKISVGVSLLLGIVLVLWLPLLVVSVGRVTSVPTRPGVFSMTVTMNNVQLWSVSSTREDVVPINTSVWDDLQRQYGTVGYRSKDVFMVNLEPASRQLWTVSPPSRQFLQRMASNSTDDIVIKMDVKIERQPEADGAPPEDPVSGRVATYTIGPNTTARESLAKMLSQQNIGDDVVHLGEILPMAIYVPSKGYVSPAFPSNPPAPVNSSTPQFTGNSSCALKLVSIQVNNNTEVEWWELQQAGEFGTNGSNSSSPTVSLVTFNEPTVMGALSYVAGLGIIGIYVSVVLVVGRFLRTLMTDLHVRTMYDDLINVDILLMLVSDIYMCREVGNLYLEEVLFRHLIEIYRDPQALLRWTDPMLHIKQD